MLVLLGLEVVSTFVSVSHAISITILVIAVVLFGELLLGWGLSIKSVVTFLASIWVVTGTESCAP
jgi:fatty acid desaturase